MKSDEVFLRHILDELDFLLKRTGGIDFDAFVADDVLKRACARSLEIIGEAVKNVSPQLRKKHKDVEWTKIAGLREQADPRLLRRGPGHLMGCHPEEAPAFEAASRRAASAGGCRVRTIGSSRWLLMRPARPIRSRPTSSYETERSHGWSCQLAVIERSQNGIEHRVQFLAHVFGKEAQHEIAVLLQHLILAPVAPIRDWIREMLRAVEFHRDTCVGA